MRTGQYSCYIKLFNSIRIGSLFNYFKIHFKDSDYVYFQVVSIVVHHRRTFYSVIGSIITLHDSECDE